MRQSASSLVAPFVLLTLPSLGSAATIRGPYAELMATLRSLTNLRVLPDPGTSNGYRTEPGPFRGWQGAPRW